MNYRSVCAYSFLVSLCFLAISCDSTEIQTDPEISVQFREYIGPVDPYGFPTNTDSLFYDNYSQTVEINSSGQSVDKVVDLTSFPYKTIPLDGNMGGFQVDIPEELFGSVYLFFDFPDPPNLRSFMVAVAPSTVLPQIPSLRLKERAEIRVYGFVLERTEQDYPENLEITWYLNGEPTSLVIRPYEHFIPTENIVRIQNSGYTSQIERGGLITKFGSALSDPSIFPVLRMDNFELWQNGESFKPLFFEWFIGGYGPIPSEGAEYGHFFSPSLKVGPETEMLYYLLRRPPVEQK